MAAQRLFSRRRILGLAAMSAAAGPVWLVSQSTTPGEIEPGQARAVTLTSSGRRTLIPGLVAQGRPLTINVSIAEVYQGGAIRVRVPRATSAVASIFGRTYPLDVDANGAIGYIGVDPLDPPGPTLLVIQAVDPVSGPVEIDRSITVLQTRWPVEYIYFPPGGGDDDSDPLDPNISRNERAMLHALYSGFSPRRWEEPWISPIRDIRITSYFGEQRSFNGGPVSGHHGGTDFGANTGTPVMATNHGRVVLAERLVVRGNMVVLDHGSGVYSGYAHLSSIDVSEGMDVAKGATIGRVGSTGLSTGPHLHWEHAVSGTLVDGLRWLDGTQGF